MTFAMYYIYEGIKSEEGKNGHLRKPIDIRTERKFFLGTKLIGEVQNVEDLLMFVGDYRWAQGTAYFLRECDDVNPRVKTKLLGILYSKTDRRASERVISQEALVRRRPRKYKTHLHPKYDKTNAVAS